MRFLPPFLAEPVRSSGERRLFEEFKKSSLPPEYHVLHSLNLPEHLYQRMGELDFVILSPRGLYVLEVKSGPVYCRNGVWTVGEGVRSYTSVKGPFAQAQDGMFSLLPRLKRMLPDENIASLTVGFGVVFPDVDFDVDGFEWDQDIVLDLTAWRKMGVTGWLLALENYWHAKSPRLPAEVSPDLIKKIALTLRPDFELARSLAVGADEADRRFVALTEEQYLILDALEASPRLLVRGGAGTGKTFLALEAARRLALSGKSVLFLTFSPLLASYLRWKLPLPRVHFSSLYAFMRSVVSHYGPSRLPNSFPGRPLTDAWFKDVLAPAFQQASEKMLDTDRFDALVIDEAQDLLNPDTFFGLSSALHGGIENGLWRIFYDPVNQAAVFGNMDADLVALLSACTSAQPVLHKNRRNTDPVVTQTALVTGADPAGHSQVSGPDVLLRYYAERREAAGLLSDWLDGLEQQTVPLTDITILSPLPFSESTAAVLPRKWLTRLVVLDGATEEALLFPFPGLTFATVTDFKGLENRFVALLDLEDLDSSSRALANLYVGMTRPRYALFMAVANSAKPHLNALIAANLPKVA